MSVSGFLLLFNLYFVSLIQSNELTLDLNGEIVNNVDFQGKAAKDTYEAASIVNYFYSYSFITEQKKMDKIVLDVGAGSGVLSIWAAQAGAKHVYSVEYTDMAKHARQIVKDNGLENAITILQTSVEDLVLPEKVDVIISEWMGMMLLRESMLDTVLLARDRHLKTNGTLWPSHATIYLSTLNKEKLRLESMDDFLDAQDSYESFSSQMTNLYNLNISSFETLYTRENENYYIYTAQWQTLKKSDINSNIVAIQSYDLNSISIDDSKGIFQQPFSFHYNNKKYRNNNNNIISGFVSWFTVDFNGSSNDNSNITNSDTTPTCTTDTASTTVIVPVRLSTGPEVGYTHWGQQVFFLKESLQLTSEDFIHGNISMIRRKDNSRMYNININYSINDVEDVTVLSYELP